MLRNLARHLGVQTVGVSDEQTWEFGGDLGEVLEAFEFGELEWCRRCAAHGCKLLTAAAERGDLDLRACAGVGLQRGVLPVPGAPRGALR